MKALLLVLTLLCFTSLAAQTDTKPTFELQRTHNEPFWPSPTKMICDPDLNPIEVVSCEGETRESGDGNPGNGAFMTWTATGSNNFYYSRIYNGADTFQIVQGGSNLSVYEPAADGSYTASLVIGAASSNQCLQPGVWTVQVWDVMDANGDELPDRDAAGNIIGCFVLCDFDFFPTCPPNEDARFEFEVENVGCNGDGSIDLVNFTAASLYCVEEDGTDGIFSWMGPNGFTSSDRSITSLEAGTYTVEVTDFYGCISRGTIDVGVLAPLTIDCSTASTPPTTVGGSDGTADIIITSGSGDYSISWAGPSSGFVSSATDGSNVINSLRPGTYTFTVTDDESGCTEMCSVTIEEPLCEIDFTVTFNEEDRNIVIMVRGGIPNFILSYEGPTNNTFPTSFGNEGIVIPVADFEPGDYEFILLEVDRSICRLSVLFTIDPPDCSDLDFAVLDLQSPQCGGTNDGLLDILYFGDFLPNILWSGPGVNGSGNSVLTDLGPGTYSFVITDSRGCTRDSSFTLTAPPELFFDCGAVDETLAALNNGKIGYRVTGGAGPFNLTYTATDPDGNLLPNGAPQAIAARDTLRNLEAGTYILTVTDVNGCSNECTATVSEPNCSLAPDCMVTNPVTAGGNGSVALNFDGVPNWNVMITGPLDTNFVTANPLETINDLPQGDYTLNVFNSAGCVGTCSFSIVGPMCALTFSGTTENPSCVGATDGTITLTINNAAPGLTVDWDNDTYDGMTVLTGLPAGDYSVNVTDQTGCPVAPQTFMLTDPAPLVVDLTLATAILCNGDSTASISATVGGSVGVLMYDWSVDSLPDMNLVSGLVAGSYHVLVTDGNGCTGRDTIIITQPELLELDCSATGESAAGSTDGTITLSNMGGAAGAGGVVRLSGDLGDRFMTAGSDTTFTGLVPGTYELRITDANGCVASCSAIVSQGGCNIAVTIAPTQPDCDSATGAATANPTNANGIVGYVWSTGETTQTLTNLTPGEYAVTATDALGCEARTDVSINAFTDFPRFENPALSAVCDDDCTELTYSLNGIAPFVIRARAERNGSDLGSYVINVSSSGDQSFTICPSDFGTPDLRNLTLRLLDVIDGNGCALDLSPVLLMINVFPAAVNTLDTMICAGTAMNYFGETFDAARPTGDVVVPTLSANGCDSTVTVNLSFFAPAFSALDTMICAGTAMNYFGETFDAARPTGDVVVPTPSANGCDSTVTVNLSFFAPAFSALDTMICAGTAMNYFGETFDAARPTGDVVVPTLSANGCDSTVTVNLSFFAPAFSALDTMICAGTAMNYFGETFDAARPTGDVVVPTLSASGCDSTVTVNLSFYSQIAGIVDTTICAGETFRFAGRDFTEVVANELIILPGADANGCDSIVDLTVNVILSAELIIAGNEVVCSGGDVAFTVENTGDLPVDIVLSTAPGMTETIPPNAVRSYVADVTEGTLINILSATNGSRCVPAISGAFTVSESDLNVGIDVMSGDGVFGVSCADGDDGALLAVASGGEAPYNFRWNTNTSGSALNNLEAGRYTVVVTGGSGCTADAVVVLDAPDVMVSAIAEIDANCRDTLPQLIVRDVQGGVGPYLYRTSNDAPFAPFANFPDTLMAAVGRNDFALEDANGCRLAQSFDLTGPPASELEISPARAIITQGDSIELVLFTDLDVAGFRISPGPEGDVAGNSIFVGPEETTTYLFNIVDSGGCAATAEVLIVIDDFIPIYAPSAFSPNDDGTNDVFRIFAKPVVASFSNFIIFDRWGEPVYEQPETVASDDASWGWNGRNTNGKAYQPAVYVFSIDVNMLDGRVITVKGDLVLMR